LSVELVYIIIYVSIYSENIVMLYKVKVKVKFNPEQATKAQRGSRVIIPLFL